MAQQHQDASPLTTALTDLVAAVTRVAKVAASTREPERPEYVSARQLGIPARTLRRLVADGVVPGSLIGREIFVARHDWAAYINSQRIQPRAERPPRARTHRRATPRPTGTHDPQAHEGKSDFDLALARGQIAVVSQ
jgi:hypothetical protein